MKKRTFLLSLISLFFTEIFTVTAQIDKASEIKFSPQNYLPDSLPNLGLLFVPGAETSMLYDTPKNRTEYNQPYIGTFSHQAHIAAFKGVVVATWSNHYGDEDSPGQYIRYSLSRDGGATWENPDKKAASGTKYAAVLFPPMEKPLRNPQPKDEEGQKISNLENPMLGYRPHDKCGSGNSDNSNSYENDNCGHYHLEIRANGFAIVNDKLFALAEVAKGINAIGIGRVVREINPNGSLGEVFWLNDDVPDLEAITPDAINEKLYSKKPDKQKIAMEITTYLQDPLHMPQWAFYHKGWVQADGKVAKDYTNVEGVTGICEPTYAYQTKEGVYTRIWRTKAKRLYAQFSYNKGKSWTELERTSFPDVGSRAVVGNLPDGRSFIVSNPYPGARYPLVLSLSGDGKLFDKAYIVRSGDPGPKDELGRAKVKGYQYPHAVVSGDYLLVIYSINKESIAVTRLPIDQL